MHVKPATTLSNPESLLFAWPVQNAQWVLLSDGAPWFRQIRVEKSAVFHSCPGRFRILVQVAKGSENVSADAKTVELRFLVGPSEIVPSDTSPDR